MQIYILIALVGVACGRLVSSPQKAMQMQKAMENPDLYEGDIILSKTGMFQDMQLWSKGVIPYIIDPSVNKIMGNIKKAMAHIEKETCITFVERTDEENYVKIHSGTGCNGGWGKLLMGEQPLSLEIGQCENVGIIVHELMHAIGFLHEHVRFDRDKYLNIFWDNIDDAKKVEFAIKFAKEAKIFDDFDYDSIMLYGPRSFSKDGVSITMQASKEGVELEDIWDKGKLSSSDIFRVNSLYRDCKLEFP